MSGIAVLAGGMLTTVQDLGRAGWQRYGVPVTGAMDAWSLRAANRLVGNPDGAAAIEMTFVAPVLRFERPVVLALAGADLGALLGGHPVAPWRSVAASAGAVLTFAGARDGMRGYLAVSGGIDVPVVLGSRSTCLTSAFGGLEGRPLRAGDRLPVGAPGPSCAGPVRRLPRRAIPAFGHTPTVRVVMGPQEGACTAEGAGTFLGETFTLALESDRVGCRFLGPRIELRGAADIVSDGTAFGSVQVTGDGLPIVLMADRGTTGGYAKIATVVTADLPRLAQAAPGDRIRFEKVGVDEAQSLLREAWSRLDEIGPADSDAGVEPAIYEEDSGAALVAEVCVELAEALDGEHHVPDAGRENTVRAAMPGAVVSVAVSTGERVTAGQTVLVLEAMKMQNPVRAPRDGVVRRVYVAPGARVEGGAPLVAIDGA